jgi:hypothetical protein
MSDTGDRIDDAADRIETAIARVETAIKDKWSTVQWIGIIFIGVSLWSLPEEIWYSKWRYTATYPISSSDV